MASLSTSVQQNLVFTLDMLRMLSTYMSYPSLPSDLAESMWYKLLNHNRNLALAWRDWTDEERMAAWKLALSYYQKNRPLYYIEGWFIKL